MKPLTTEWVEKAEEDFAAAVHLIRLRRPAVPNVVCFHCQQCAEKYLKARLQEADIPFTKTHNLETLLDLILPVEPMWETMREWMNQLSDYAIESRYPGDTATPDEAKRSIAQCKAIRQRVRQSLGLEPPERQTEFRVREKKDRYRTRRKKK